MAIVVLDPAQVLLFLATGGFPARWGKSTCAERVLLPGGTCESEDRLESLFPILNLTKKRKKKEKHLL